MYFQMENCAFQMPRLQYSSFQNEVFYWALLLFHGRMTIYYTVQIGLSSFQEWKGTLFNFDPSHEITQKVAGHFQAADRVHHLPAVMF